ncbi:hypothetical protein B0H10DRAFT_2224413 [Mycena sp. CBHHK59/15]|nr:hypothetical protein B0H10DRAFT_2224413 [Mycena sp. CBHHK59/15]
MPVPRVPTAYIISFSSVRDTYKDEDGETMNLELILKDKDCHSWDGTPGERQTGRAPSVNVKLFAGVGVFEKTSNAMNWILTPDTRSIALKFNSD